jgi:hypothetical protein
MGDFSFSYSLISISNRRNSLTVNCRTGWKLSPLSGNAGAGRFRRKRTSSFHPNQHRVRKGWEKRG